MHCGGVGLQLDGAVSLTCLRNPPAPCAGDLRAHPRRQRVPLLKSPSGPKQTLLSPNDRGSRAFEMLTLLPLSMLLRRPAREKRVFPKNSLPGYEFLERSNIEVDSLQFHPVAISFSNERKNLKYKFF